MANGYNKIYARNYWVNNTPPAINEVNLNNLENGLNTLDDRVVTLDKTKLDQITANTMVKDVTFDEATGIFTVTKLNGTTFTIDTKLEKITTNWTYDKDSQQIILTLDDGTKQYIDLSALITQYEFLDSDTITFVISAEGKVKAIIKNGSITGDMLEPNYLANVTVQASKAETSANASAQSASDSAYNAKLSQSYSIGGSGIRSEEDVDNAKYYKEQASLSADSAATSETNAKSSETNAASSATLAETSKTAAATSEANAKTSETNAKTSETNAESSKMAAAVSENNAKASETNAASSAGLSESYAVGTDGTVRPNDNVDCAKYYYEQARSISESFSGALKPKGTVSFANLPELSSITAGDMYNISDEFVTTSDFMEGAGNTVPAGSNIFKTVDDKWDVLAGSPVTGIKGEKETTFRRGNVNITAENLGALKTNGDASNTTATFTKASDYTNIVSGEKLSVIFGKIMNWFSFIGESFSQAFEDIGLLQERFDDLNSNKISYRDIVDNLTDTSSDKPLSANMGRELAEGINTINNNLINFTNGGHVDNCNNFAGFSNGFKIGFVNTSTTNAPNATYGLLVYEGNADVNWYRQTVHETLTNNIYSRIYSNGTWSEWLKIITNNDLNSIFTSGITSFSFKTFEGAFILYGWTDTQHKNGVEIDFLNGSPGIYFYKITDGETMLMWSK